MSATPNASPTVTIDCPRCCAHGSIVAFSHIANGVCFLCAGSKRIDVAAGSEAAVNAETVARATAQAARRNEWIASIGAQTTADVLAALRGLSDDRLNAIRNWTAGLGRDDEPVTTRRVYWCASTLLNAWPGRTAYPESWIDG